MSFVFDAEALLAFYLGEPRGRAVQKLLDEVVKRKARGYLNIVNLTELYYILYRRSPALAKEKERNLRAYGIDVVPVNDETLWREAARTKGEHALSLADAFAAATAKAKNATLLIGRDIEFDDLDIPIKRIS
ncbi:MAG: PIN domain-containing protein [Candidatus Bathyarchaeia archaeon]